MESGQVFPTISRAEETSILNICTAINVIDAQVIVERGDPGSDMFIIKKGTFKVIDERNGEDFILTVLKKNDIFGEMSFIDDMPRSATVVAMEPGILLRLGKEEFARLQDINQKLGTDLVLILARLVVERLRRTDESLLFLAFGDKTDSDKDEIRKLIREMRVSVHLELSKEGLHRS